MSQVLQSGLGNDPNYVSCISSRVGIDIYLLLDAAPVVLYEYKRNNACRHDLVRPREHVVSKNMQDTANTTNANIFTIENPACARLTT